MGVSRGFTLVELVIVIALLGIISVSVLTRWFSTDAFQADTLMEQLLSEARLAQRTALANSQNTVSLVISESSGDWRCQIFQDSGGGPSLMREVLADSGGVDMQVTAGSTVGLGSGVNLDLSYDGLGNVEQISIGGAPGDVSSGVALVLAGGTHQLCISPLGYAHEGTCI
jgi:MSHA pilin protein MshC